jgi:uncharacterized protein (TIGR03435 family)
MPHLNDLADKFKDKAVRFIAITEEDENLVASFLKRRTMNAWIGLDSDHSATRVYANEVFPTTILIDRDSKIAQITRPKNVTEEMLNALLSGIVTSPAANEAGVSIAPAKTTADVKTKRILTLTIDRTTSDENNWAMYPGNFKGQMTLRTALSIIYNVPETLIIGPPVLTEGRYDITASLSEGDKTALKPIIAKAIEDSFKLKVHKETRDTDVFILTVPDQNRLKLRVDSGTNEHWSSDEGVLAASAAPLKRLVDGLTGLLGQPVVDETNLKDKYNWDVLFDAKNHDSIIESLRRDLGLELKRAKRAIEVYVVEPADPLTGALSSRFKEADSTGRIVIFHQFAAD